MCKDIRIQQISIKVALYNFWDSIALYIDFMKYLVLALLLAVALTKVLINSNHRHLIATYPPHHKVVKEKYHSAVDPNKVGFGSEWVWIDGGDAWPGGFHANFSSWFYDECLESPLHLHITADNVFKVWLNGHLVGEGNNLNHVYKFEIKPHHIKCHQNHLKFHIVNHDDNSPAGFVYALLQDQEACYKCRHSNGFYDWHTCSCKCSCDCGKHHSCGCPPKKEWHSYPSCGCICKQQHKHRKLCKYPRDIWDEEHCECRCEKKWCAPPRQWNYKTCKCQCPPSTTAVPCVAPYYFNQDTCSCQCNQTIAQTCSGISTVFEPSVCGCVGLCNPVGTCTPPKVWDYSDCKCHCKKIKCPVGMVHNVDTCQCECAECCKDCHKCKKHHHDEKRPFVKPHKK